METRHTVFDTVGGTPLLYLPSIGREYATISKANIHPVLSKNARKIYYFCLEMRAKTAILSFGDMKSNDI